MGAAEEKLLGNDHLRAGRLESARDCYSRALETCEEPAEVAALHCNRALAELKLGQHSKCVADCDAAIAMQPRYGKAFFRRAQAREALNQISEAFKDVHQLIRFEPENKEAKAYAIKLKQAMEMRAALGDLSTPSLAVEKLLEPKATEAERVQALGKLSRIAEDKDRALSLLHSGAVPPLLALLPSAGAVRGPGDIAMPLVGLCVEVLERMAQSEELGVLKAIAAPGGADADAAEAPWRAVLAIAAAAARAHEGEAAEAAEAEGAGAAGAEGAAAAHGAAGAGAADSEEAQGEEATPGGQGKNLLVTACKCVSLVSLLATQRGAVGSQATQGAMLQALLPMSKSAQPRVKSAALDGLLRVADKDVAACRAVLPSLISALSWQLGDEESAAHRVALATMHKLLQPEGGDDKNAESKLTQALCAACEASLSVVLRSSSASWEEHVAAVHGVTAVLESNKAVGGWLLKQESIFWALAEVSEMEDDQLSQSLAEIYAHAANDAQHFREKAGDEPIKHLKAMLKSTKPPIRARACVALAKVSLIHHDHRVAINPSGKLLQATLGLLEAKVPPSVHRWAVDALMFLTIMPEVKEHLYKKKVTFGSLTSLSESVSKDAGASSLQHSMVSALRQMCCPRDKSDEQKRLEQEMDPKQIEQMKQLSNPQGHQPSEKEEDPAVLKALAAQLAHDDATLVVAELVAHAPEGARGVLLASAQVLLAFANTESVRGKIVQQGGFKAALTLVLADHKPTQLAAAWALARIAISINPALYPRRTGSGPEGMVKPMLQLVDEADNELQQFEACLGLTNLATVPELRERIVGAGGWRTLQMALTCDNPLVQRAALECLSNLVAAEGVIERFTEPESTDLKIFVGFCGSEDVKCQIAASGGLATLAELPEVSAALIRCKGGIDAFVELAIVAEDPAILHRAAVALKHMVLTQMDLIVGAEGAAPPDHGMPTLGALTVLAKSGVAPVKQAALTAIVELQRRRPDIALPHPDLVAQVVDNLRAEAARRAAEAEAEEAAAAQAEALRGSAERGDFSGITEDDEEADVPEGTVEDLGEVV